MDFLIFNL